MAAAAALILPALLGACGAAQPSATVAPTSAATVQLGTPQGFAASTLVADVVADPAFAGFGRYIFPVKNRDGVPDGMRLDGVGSLLPYHHAIQTSTTIEVLDYLRGQAEQGNRVFYDIYSDAEQRADPAKDDTGLFFFRGEPGAPFAIVCAGGGFSYVGSIHESFPQALELSKLGYNAFAIEYRLGSRPATEDLAAAVSYVFASADQLEVSTEGYSLWGGSAGARMAAAIGSHGAASYGGADLPRPATVVIGYTGHSDYVPGDTPTFTFVSQDDPIASATTVQQRVDNLRAVGVDVEFELYEHAGHGFGLGLGTDAEGWLGRAVAFWERHQEGVAAT
jgi:acetyl esterase/lipase